MVIMMEKIKDFLKRKWNNKLKFLFGLTIFVLINIIFGLLTPVGIFVNFILLFISFIVITTTDGVFKHNDK